MTGTLKILEKSNGEERQSLRIDVPAKLLEGIEVEADGTVGIDGLMRICQRLMRLQKLAAKLETAQSSLPSTWAK